MGGNRQKVNISMRAWLESGKPVVAEKTKYFGRGSERPMTDVELSSKIMLSLKNKYLNIYEIK